MKVHKAKNGAFYKILPDGRCRFVSAAAARKAKGSKVKAKSSTKKSAKSKKATSRKRARR